MQETVRDAVRFKPSTVAFPFFPGLALMLSSATADWEPPPPMPDEFDWVQLVSGEWLKGEIKVMYQDVLEFDSEELDDLSLDLEDITVIRSAQIINLRVSSARDPEQSGRFGDQVATGQLLLEGDTATVIGDNQISFPRASILSITAGVARERNYWTGDVVVGGNFRSGNTEQTEANTRVNFQRRTVVSRFNADHIGNYSRTNGVETVNNQRGSVKWDRFRTERLFVTPIYAEYFSDPFQNIAARYTISSEAGFQLIDTAKTDWSVSAGPAFQQTRNDQVAAGESKEDGSWAIGAGMAYSTDLTRRIEFDYDYRFLFTSKEAGSYNHHMISALSFELTRAFDFDLSVIWDRIRDPRPNSDGTVPEKDDYRLTMGFGFDF